MELTVYMYVYRRMRSKLRRNKTHLIKSNEGKRFLKAQNICSSNETVLNKITAELFSTVWNEGFQRYFDD